MLPIEKHTPLRQVTAYVPDAIVQWYATAGSSVHTSTTLHGTLLCIDASGFTALTRRLSDQGREGPEILTEILNTFFEKIAAAVFAWQGDVLKFAGDALWVYIAGDFDPFQFRTELLAALDDVNAAHPLTTEHPLTIHTGAERGSFALASFGIADFRLEAELVGQLVEQVYAACDVAGLNEMALGPELARTSGFQVLEDGFARVGSSLSQHSHTKREDSGRSVSSIHDSTMLAKYLPADVLNRLHSGDDRLQSEHRLTAVLFARIEVSGESAGDTREALAPKIRDSFSIIRSFGGTVARLDPFKAGHKLLVFFGAPVKQEDDELRAVVCAQQLIGLTDSSVSFGVGVALGTLLCGEVGASTRREYTVMGDGVNLAARLMARADWGDVLINDRLLDRLPQSVSTEPLSYSLKGLGNDVRVHRVTGFTESTSRESVSDSVIEQAQHQGWLRTKWQSAKHVGGRVVRVAGEAGVGKTTLVTRFLEGMRDSGGDERAHSITCRDALLYGTGWLARKLLQCVLPPGSVSGDPNLLEAVEEVAGTRWMPLIAPFVDADIVDNEWTRELPPDIRLAKTAEVYADLVGSFVSKPTAIVVDDFHRADEISKYIVDSLGATITHWPLLLVLTERACPDSSDFNEDPNCILIKSPSVVAWRRFFEGYFEHGPREREFSTKLLDYSDGNPQWITQYLSHCVDQGWLTTNPVSGRWEVLDTNVFGAAPESISSLHLARFDSLSSLEREWLKVAATALGPFQVEDVTAIAERSLSREEIKSLIARGYLAVSSGTSAIDFADDAMRDAVYSVLPDKIRRHYHAAYARRLVDRDETVRADLLALHFFRGENWPEAFAWSLKAARSALSNHALIDAGRLFHQCSSIARRSDVELPGDNVLSFYREYVDFLHLEGRLTESYPVCRYWRKTARKISSIDGCLEAPLEAARTLWKQSRYGRARYIVERLLDSPVNEDWPRINAGVNTLMAEIERRQARFDSAQRYCYRAIAIAGQNGDRAKLSEAHNMLGLALWGSGNLEAAADSFNTSLRYEDDTHGVIHRAEVLNNLAIIHYSLGEYKLAAELLEEVVAIFRDVGYRQNEAYASGNLANISRILGKLDRCRELLLRADAIFSRSDDRHAHYYSVGNLGDLDLVLGEWESAQARFQEALEFAEGIGDKELAAECRVRRGDLAFFTNQPDLAESLYQEAIEQAEAIGSLEYHLRGLIGLARLAIQRRDTSDARRLIDQITARAGEERVIIAENEARFLQGELHRIHSESEEAIGVYRAVLNYSLANGMFELALKAAVRWYETGSESTREAASCVQDLISRFAEENVEIDGRKTLLSSGYFTHFFVGLNEVATKSPAS